MDTADPILIRTATADDAEGMAELVTHLGYPTGVESMRTRLQALGSAEGYATWVAARGARLVGFTGAMRGWSYTHDGPFARLLALVVAPDERGRGTGAALVGEVERWARAQGAAQLHLTTALHRGDAHRFYEGLGYQNSGRRYLKRLD
jgi:GNAT superfamily N-acetyltransferase